MLRPIFSEIQAKNQFWGLRSTLEENASGVRWGKLCIFTKEDLIYIFQKNLWLQFCSESAIFSANLLGLKRWDNNSSKMTSSLKIFFLIYIFLNIFFQEGSYYAYLYRKLLLLTNFNPFLFFRSSKKFFVFFLQFSENFWRNFFYINVLLNGCRTSILDDWVQNFNFNSNNRFYNSIQSFNYQNTETNVFHSFLTIKKIFPWWFLKKIVKPPKKGI